MAGGTTLRMSLRLERFLIGLKSYLRPQLFSFEGMRRVNEIWNQPEIANEYLGADSVTHPPGDIDPAKTIIIGECEPDGPIALDYRPSNPRVIYLCDIGSET